MRQTSYTFAPVATPSNERDFVDPPVCVSGVMLHYRGRKDQVSAQYIMKSPARCSAQNVFTVNGDFFKYVLSVLCDIKHL